MSIHRLKPYPGWSSVTTADTAVIGLRRTSGVTGAAKNAFAAGDTIVTSTLDLGSPLPSLAGRARVGGSVRGAERPVPDPRKDRSTASSAEGNPSNRPPARSDAPPGDSNSPRRGRHAKPPARAGWAHFRAVPWFHENKRVIIGAVIALALLGIGADVMGWGGAPARPCGLFYPGKEGSDVCADTSGTVSMDNLTVSATSLATTDNRTGGLALCSSVTLTNNSGHDQDYTAADFKIQNPASEMTSTTSGTLRTAGTLGLGGTKTGTICDDRPAQQGVYALMYEPSVLGAQRGVWLTQH